MPYTTEKNKPTKFSKFSNLSNWYKKVLTSFFLFFFVCFFFDSFLILLCFTLICFCFVLFASCCFRVFCCLYFNSAMLVFPHSLYLYETYFHISEISSPSVEDPRFKK